MLGVWDDHDYGMNNGGKVCCYNVYFIIIIILFLWHALSDVRAEIVCSTHIMY